MQIDVQSVTINTLRLKLFFLSFHNIFDLLCKSSASLAASKNPLKMTKSTPLIIIIIITITIVVSAIRC